MMNGPVFHLPNIRKVMRLNLSSCEKQKIIDVLYNIIEWNNTFEIYKDYDESFKHFTKVFQHYIDNLKR